MRKPLGRLTAAAAVAALLCGGAARAQEPQPAQSPAMPVLPPPPPTDIERVSFDDAVARALEKNTQVAQAAQAILQAEALLQQARVVYQPSVNGSVNMTVLDSSRGFDGLVTQPRTQTALGANASFPILEAARWAAATQARDQVAVAQLSAADVRRQVGTATAQAYLAVIAEQRQVAVNTVAIENAKAHLDDAHARLQAGAGSRLNELRASQELATDVVLLENAQLALRRAQEALGVLLMADKAVDAAGEPAFEVPAAPADESWLGQRTDIQLFNASLDAAERVVKDSWKDWVPTATASFQPQYLTPAGLFQPARTWQAVISASVPVFDGGQRRANRRLREVERNNAQLTLDASRVQARSELRTAEAAVESTERAVANARLAAQSAADVVRITDLAFRAGATTNLEVIDAQRAARDADTAVALAEDQVRRARLDLLVALGRFPQ